MRREEKAYGDAGQWSNARSVQPRRGNDTLDRSLISAGTVVAYILSSWYHSVMVGANSEHPSQLVRVS